MREEAARGFDLTTGPLIRGRLIGRGGRRARAADHDAPHRVGRLVDGSAGARAEHAVWGLCAGAKRIRCRRWQSSMRTMRCGSGSGWKERCCGSRRSTGGSSLRERRRLLELPADRARPAQQEYAGGHGGLELDEKLTAGLKAVSQRHGVTLYMTLLAGWAVLLARLSGQEDVVIGTPVANRGRAEIEELIGFFVNTLAMRVELSGSTDGGRAAGAGEGAGAASAAASGHSVRAGGRVGAAGAGAWRTARCSR